MGLNHISIAAVAVLLGAAPVLHAETAANPVSPAAETPAAAPAPESDPALQASPIAGTAQAQTAPAPDEAPASPVTGGTAAEPAAASPEAAPPAATTGDVLTVPEKKPAAKRKKASSAPIRIEEDGMPGRGASMAQVEKRFGKPRQKLKPVGDPPITRWVYGDYTVYFEHEYVIHSVRNDGKTETPAPSKPASETEGAPADTAPMTTSPETEAPPASGE